MRKTKVEKGITLVALIITIIVLLILAVVAINAVQNDGIIEHAKNARYEYKNAQYDEQVTLDYYLSQLQSSTGKGTAHGGIIPKDGSYTKAGTSTPLEEGEKFPESPVEDDVYEYGDYKYTYYNNYSTINPKLTWEFNDQMNGWYVQISDAVGKNETKYGEILTTINGADVKSIGGTFVNCTSLEIAPTIPSTIVDMRSTFGKCSSLKNVPTIPDSVINMKSTFQECTALEIAPTISKNATNLDGTFGRCTNLRIVPNLPQASEESEINMHSTFANCPRLESIPDIPSNVTNLRLTFLNCTSLPDTITINTENVTDYTNCFSGSASASGNKIALKGIKADANATEYTNQGLLENLAGTANNGNVEVFDLKSQG